MDEVCEEKSSTEEVERVLRASPHSRIPIPTNDASRSISTYTVRGERPIVAYLDVVEK